MRTAHATAVGSFALLLAAAGCFDAPSEAAVKVGAKAEDFTLRTTDGGAFTLSALRGDAIAVIGVGNPYG